MVAYAESYPEADLVRRRAVSAGLSGVQVAQDGCGRARVFVDVESPEESGALIAAARAANMTPTLEGVDGRNAP